MYKSFNQEIKTMVYSQCLFHTPLKPISPLSGIEVGNFLELLKKYVLALDLVGFFHPV